MKYAGSRGQLFPLWAFGMLLVCALSALLLEFGHRLSCQVRVQSDADSAVAALISVQAQDYNRMTMILYAMSIEETRIRQLADSLYLSARGIGYCTPGTFATGGCEGNYGTLKPAYIQAVNRYATLVQLLHDATYRSTAAGQSSDAQVLLKLLTDPARCGTATGLDCEGGLTYNFVPGNAGFQLAGPGTISMSYQAGAEDYFSSSTYGGTPTMPTSGVFEPARVQITTCATVKPLLASFFGFSAAAYTVSATAAAMDANVALEEESPGLVTLTATGAPMQPVDQLVPRPAGDLSGATPQQDDMYNPVFRSQAGNSLGRGQPQQTDWSRKALRIDAVWWGPVPIHPYLTGATCP